MVWHKPPDLGKIVRLDNHNYYLTNNLKKNVDLPDFHKNDLDSINPVRKDFVLVMYTIKGIFFNATSKCKERFVVFTRSGYLLIYKSNNEGILVNIKHAKSLKFDKFNINFEGEKTKFHGITLNYDFGRISLLLNHNQRSSFCSELMALYHEPPHHVSFNDNVSIRNMNEDNEGKGILGDDKINETKEQSNCKSHTFEKSGLLTMDSFVDGCKITSTPLFEKLEQGELLDEVTARSFGSLLNESFDDTLTDLHQFNVIKRTESTLNIPSFGRNSLEKKNLHLMRSATTHSPKKRRSLIPKNIRAIKEEEDESDKSSEDYDIRRLIANFDKKQHFYHKDRINKNRNIISEGNVKSLTSLFEKGGSSSLVS
uniref:Myristylated tegument protein CIRC n=1 Tax=Parastrongyloides trichosuri TaxID=131310 RepID=A0A0N5A1R4_PARTI